MIIRTDNQLMRDKNDSIEELQNRKAKGDHLGVINAGQSAAFLELLVAEKQNTLDRRLVNLISAFSCLQDTLWAAYELGHIKKEFLEDLYKREPKQKTRKELAEERGFYRDERDLYWAESDGWNDNDPRWDEMCKHGTKENQ